CTLGYAHFHGRSSTRTVRLKRFVSERASGAHDCSHPWGEARSKMVGHGNVGLDHAETKLAAAPSGADLSQACLTLAGRSPALGGHHPWGEARNNMVGHGNVVVDHTETRLAAAPSGAELARAASWLISDKGTDIEAAHRVGTSVTFSRGAT